MRAMDMNPKDYDGDFDLDGVPEEIQELAGKLYNGLHPALRAIGVPYTSREDVAQRETIRRVVELVNRLGETEAASDALEAIFG